MSFLSEMVSLNATSASVRKNLDILHRIYFSQNVWLMFYLAIQPVETELINELFYFDPKTAIIVFRMTL